MNTFFLSLFFALNMGLSEGGLYLWESNTGLETLTSIKNTHTDFYSELKLNYKTSNIYIGGGIDCSSKQSGSFLEIGKYKPVALNFPFVVGIRYKKIIEIGFKYSCLHPMTTYLYDDDIKYKQEGAYKTLFIKFTGEIKLL